MSQAVSASAGAALDAVVLAMLLGLLFFVCSSKFDSPGTWSRRAFLLGPRFGLGPIYVEVPYSRRVLLDDLVMEFDAVFCVRTAGT